MNVQPSALEKHTALSTNFRENNFDLLRILFALQVLLFHANEHLGLHNHWLESLAIIPGVPAFFFVSGFLIAASFENCRGLGEYTRNRCLRILPGLLATTLLAVAVIIAVRGFGFAIQHASTLAIWIAAQSTIGQAYNPAAFRTIGIGVMNGSLWTITVELLFYVTLPILLVTGRWLKASTTTVIIAACTSFAFYAAGLSGWLPSIGSKNLAEFLSLTPIAWGWMFACGILIYLHFDRAYVHRHWLGIAGLFGMTACAFAPASWHLLCRTHGNELGLLYYVSYASAVFAAAYSFPRIKLAGDYSYGIYIYHMPMVNLLIASGVLALLGSAPGLVLVAFATVGLSVVSWHLIEKPSLRRKKRSLAADDHSTPAAVIPLPGFTSKAA